MRDCQILFEPYSFEDIQSIIELKKNSLFQKCVPTEKQCDSDPVKLDLRKKLKSVFFDIIEEKALHLLSKKIS